MATSTFESIRQRAVAAGDRGFCVPLAYSVVSGVDFDEVNFKMMVHGVRKKGSGAYQSKWEPFGRDVLNLHMEDVTSHALSYGRTVRTVARGLNKGKYLVKVRRHLLAMVDGVVHDWTAGRQHRIQQVWRITSPSDAVAVEAPVSPAVPQPATPRPIHRPLPQPTPVAPKKRDVAASGRNLLARLQSVHGFSTWQLGMSGKFVKFNTLQGTAYLSPARNQRTVRFFIRNEETLAHLAPLLEDAGHGVGTETKKYTYWTLSLVQLEALRDIL